MKWGRCLSIYCVKRDVSNDTWKINGLVLKSPSNTNKCQTAQPTWQHGRAHVSVWSCLRPHWSRVFSNTRLSSLPFSTRPTCLWICPVLLTFRHPSILPFCPRQSINPIIRPVASSARSFIRRPRVSVDPGRASSAPGTSGNTWCCGVSSAPTPWSCSTTPFSRCRWRTRPSSCSGEVSLDPNHAQAVVYPTLNPSPSLLWTTRFSAPQ